MKENLYQHLPESGREEEPDARVIAFGAGVQSTALVAMNTLGEVDNPADFAVFADTGGEPAPLYDHLDFMVEWCGERGFPIHVASVGDLKEDVLNNDRFSTPPFFTKDPKNPDSPKGHLRRNCTRDYKIRPIARKIREVLGYRPRQHIKHLVEVWLGISLDEWHRIKESSIKWQVNRHPLVELEMTRKDCIEWLEEHGIEPPPKSSCTFCPYHSDGYWRWLKENHPDEFQEVVEFDEQIRDFHEEGRGGIKEKLYVYGGAIPLREAKFGEDQPRLFGESANACDGYCEF